MCYIKTKYVVLYCKYLQLFLFFSKKDSMSHFLFLHLFSKTLPLLNQPKLHHYDTKQQEFKIQINKVLWLIPILTALFIPNHILKLTPLTVHIWEMLMPKMLHTIANWKLDIHRNWARIKGESGWIIPISSSSNTMWKARS